MWLQQANKVQRTNQERILTDRDASNAFLGIFWRIASVSVLNFLFPACFRRALNNVCEFLQAKKNNNNNWQTSRRTDHCLERKTLPMGRCASQRRTHSHRRVSSIAAKCRRTIPRQLACVRTLKKANGETHFEISN